MPQEPPVTQRHGVEGKWVAMSDELVELKERNQALMAEVRDLQAELDVLKNSDVVTLLADKVALAAEVRSAKEATADTVLALSEDEQEAMDGLMVAFNIIGNRWKLSANQSELTSAVHTIQTFITQHMLHRAAPKKWGSWWATREGE